MVSQPQPKPTETPWQWWPVIPLLKPRAHWPWPANPRPALPKEPGDQVWDDPFWYA